MTVTSSARPGAPSIVIVGAGLAGLFCALKLSPLPVTLLAAAPLGQGASSAWAQGGIAAAIGEGDSVEKHLADTLHAGAGLVDEAAARGMIAEAGSRIHDLLRYGVPFDRDLDGRLRLSREAAHSERRIVRVKGDGAGRAIMEALVAAVRRTPSTRVIEMCTAERLLVEDGEARGLLARRGETRLHIPASRVVLATGGIGQLYAVTTNPLEAAGSGLALAARAGATVADPEFVQFHPTALAVGRDPAPLATEALRGEGAVLVDETGRRFMAEHHADGELAPRDIVSRALFAEIRRGHRTFLDAHEAIGAAFPEHFPAVAAACLAAGVDPVREPIPVAPAAHYHMGGLLTDEAGRTSIPGLFACGEVASTGVHGANRLASNSLLEAVVFAGRIAAGLRTEGEAVLADLGVDTSAPPPVQADPAAVARLRAVMTRDVGVLRDATGLRRALREIDALDGAGTAPALADRLAVARLVAASALARAESRGAHARADHPAPLPQAVRTLTTLAQAGETAANLIESEAA